MNGRMLAAITTGLFGLALTAQCLAADSGWFVSLGAFAPKASTNIRVNAQNGTLGTDLHLETDLGLPDRRVVPQATFGYRFTARSSLEFSYFDLRRTGSRVIDENISYDGQNYQINTLVSTFSDSQTKFVQYRYTFLDTPGWKLSAAAGLHSTRFTLGLSDISTGESQSANATVPLPLVGLRALYDADGWRLHAEATYFSMRVNSIHGHLNDYTLGVARRLPYQLSAELGFTRFVLIMTAQRATLSGTGRFAYQGPFLTLCYGCL